jgi:TPR repeat protein
MQTSAILCIIRPNSSRLPGSAFAAVFFSAMLLAFLLLAAILAASTAARAQNFNPAALQSQAQSGDATAQLQLGTLDYVGIGVVQDYIGAINLLKSAANAGNAEAACEAGFLYQTGSFAQGPPPPDPADALQWYQKSAAAGDACGEFGLGYLYQTGQGVKPDPVQAAAWFAKAAAQGMKPDPTTFPLQQIQQHFYALADQVTGVSGWVDTVSTQAGGDQD